jgi:hypothetical protein
MSTSNHGSLANAIHNPNDLNNYITVYDGTSIEGNNINIQNHMSTDKVAKLVYLLVGEDEIKLKNIVRSDIDRTLSEEIIKNNEFDLNFYYEMFSRYLDLFDSSSGWKGDIGVFEILVDKVTHRSQLTKFENILWDSPLAMDYHTSAQRIQDSITLKKDSMPMSTDFITEEE